MMSSCVNLDIQITAHIKVKLAREKVWLNCSGENGRDGRI